MSAAELKREGQMRAALRRQYPLRPGGIARWVASRDARRKRNAERAEKNLFGAEMRAEFDPREGKRGETGEPRGGLTKAGRSVVAREVMAGQ